MTSKTLDTSQPTFYFFLITLVITIIKQYMMGSGSDITWSLIYLITTLITQYVFNIFLTSELCGSVQYILAFYATFVPWTVIFGTLQIILLLIPGWLRPFSNTFGYIAARLLGPEDVIKKIFQDPSSNSENAEALNHIYNDPSQIINELPTDKNLLMKRLKDMKESEMVKDNIDVYDTNQSPLKDLLYILYLKDNVSYLIWYLLTGITVINISKGYILNSSCEQNIDVMEEEYEDYLAEKAEKEQDNTVYNS